MDHRQDPESGLLWRNQLLTRRGLLRRALASGSVLGLASIPRLDALAWQAPPEGGGAVQGTAQAFAALTLARELNAMRYEELPPLAIEHAKMIIASTLSSAALGSDFEFSTIIRGLAKEHGGRPEATVWFDGAKLPAHEVARVNAMLSDAAASDDSDIRNTAHYGTSLATVGLAIAERTGATGRDLLHAMVLGYEAGGRMSDARSGGGGGIHTSQAVGFAGAVVGGRLLNLSDEQLAQALGVVAFTMGGLGGGTNNGGRPYMGANAAFCGAYSALVASRGIAVNENVLEGWVNTYGGGDVTIVTREREELDIVRYLGIKLWPGAHPFSGTVEAAVNAIRQANVPSGEVGQILVVDGGVGGSRRPQTYGEGITSLPYFVASAVADRDFSWVHATPEKMFSTAIYSLMDMVQVDPAPPAVDFTWGWGGGVTIVTRSGGRYTSTVDAPRGSAPRGIEWSDVDSKYRALVPYGGLSSSRIEETLDLIHDFESVLRVSQLTNLLS